MKQEEVYPLSGTPKLHWQDHVVHVAFVILDKLNSTVSQLLVKLCVMALQVHLCRCICASVSSSFAFTLDLKNVTILQALALISVRTGICSRAFYTTRLILVCKHGKFLTFRSLAQRIILLALSVIKQCTLCLKPHLFNCSSMESFRFPAVWECVKCAKLC